MIFLELNVEKDGDFAEQTRQVLILVGGQEGGVMHVT